jgi:DNA-binding response OmpR family regulator
MDSVAKKGILFVDDDQDWRGRAQGSLAKAGYEVLVAMDASEALLHAEDPRLGLIIVDDNLAGESGLMLAKFLHRNHPEVPTLLYTTKSYDEVMILHMLDQGADQCLAKGSMEELVLTVGSYIG